jgi:ATP-dependent DNA helicase RecQ
MRIACAPVSLGRCALFFCSHPRWPVVAVSSTGSNPEENTLKKRALARVTPRGRRVSARRTRLNGSARLSSFRDGERLYRAFAESGAPVLLLADVAVAAKEPERPAAATGVRLGRLPPRGEGAGAPPPELTRPAGAPRSDGTEQLVVTPSAPRAPFRHETWQSVERAASELGLGELNPDQRKVIRAALEGRDTLVAMPNGLARAACHLVPARLSTQPVLMVSARPHLLRELADRALARRMAAVRIDACTPQGELERSLDRIALGGSLLVLATPGILLGDALPRALAKSGIALAVVDGAHVLASSSDEIAPAALGLAGALERLGSPPTMALLAAAPPALRHEVAEELRLRSPVLVETAPLGANISLDVVEARGELRQRALVQLALRLRRPGLIFAQTAREVEAIYGALSALRLPVHRFHPHLPPGERVGEQLNFFVPGRRSIMVATSAFAVPSGVVGVGEAELLDRAPTDFGLGVEKRDIRFVIHWSRPPSLEQYVREVTLAGRDGEESTAVLFHDTSDPSRCESFLQESRLAPRHFLQLGRALEPAAIDGRPRTLEALALASGLSRRLTETLVMALDDAGLVGHASGWVKTRVAAPALAARTQKLAAALDGLRRHDGARLAAMQSYTATRSCHTRALERYFGHCSEVACGRCGACRGSVLPEFDTPLAESGHVRRPAATTFSVGDDGYGLVLAAPAREVRPLTVKLGELRRAR